MAKTLQKKKTRVNLKENPTKGAFETAPAFASKSPPSRDDIAKEHGFAQPIYIKLNPLTGSKEAFSRCSKCGMVGSCKLLEEQSIEIEGEPFRLAIARCFWMEHNFRVLLSK